MDEQLNPYWSRSGHDDPMDDDSSIVGEGEAQMAVYGLVEPGNSALDAQRAERSLEAALTPVDALEFLVSVLDATMDDWDEPWRLFAIADAGLTTDPVGIGVSVVPIAHGNGHPYEQLVGCAAPAWAIGAVLVSEGWIRSGPRREIRIYTAVLADGTSIQCYRERGVSSLSQPMPAGSGRVTMAIARLVGAALQLTVPVATVGLALHTHLAAIVPTSAALTAGMDPFAFAAAVVHGEPVGTLAVDQVEGVLWEPGGVDALNAVIASFARQFGYVDTSLESWWGVEYSVGTLAENLPAQQDLLHGLRRRHHGRAEQIGALVAHRASRWGVPLWHGGVALRIGTGM